MKDNSDLADAISRYDTICREKANVRACISGGAGTMFEASGYPEIVYLLPGT